MRLTKKKEYGYMLEIKGVDTSIGQKTIIIGDTANKLGQLEDIEDELGIDLLTLFKALKDGVYYRFDKKSKVTKMKKPMLRVIDNKLCLIAPKWITATWMNISLKDYGKTWALTKEELEK